MIDDIESGRVEPTDERLRAFLFLTGHELDRDGKQRRRALGVDEALYERNLRLLPEERMELTIELSRELLRVRAAGARAQRERFEELTRELRGLAGQ